MSAVLPAGIHLLLALLLLMPLVVSPGGFAHFVVSKAIYARILIEILAVAWVFLLIKTPGFRPPPSWVLLAFGFYALASLLAAVWGINSAHSIWSSYDRMTGVWDLTHWLLLALVIASIVRSPRTWRLLLNGQLGIALILCLIALTQVYGIPLLPYIAAKCRVDATLGNPSFLASILVMSTLVAAGLLARSFLKPGQQDSISGTITADQKHGKRRDNSGAITALRVFWFAVTALGVFVLIQTGTRGALIGLLAGALAMPAALLIWGNRQALKPIALASGAILLAVAALYAIDLSVGLPVAPGCENQTASARLTHLASAAADDSSVDASLAMRLASVKAGFLGFLDRPVLGWGPENFGYAFDRHVDAQIFQHGSFVLDKAHNQIIEELTTKGIIGALAFVFMWVTLVWAVVRRRRAAGEEALAYGVLGALAAYFFQNLFLFDTPSAQLYWVIFAAWVAWQEQKAAPAPDPVSEDDTPKMAKGLLLPRFQKIALPALSRPWSRGVALAATVALLGFSVYFLNYQPYLAAQSFGESRQGGLSITERLALSRDSFDAFPAMANLPRRLAFLELVRAWDFMSPAERKQAFEFVGREASAALGADPHNAPLLISAILFAQSTTQSPTAAVYVEPLLRQLQDIAPNRAETHQFMANQALWQGRYAEALSIAEQFESRAPGTEWFFTGIKYAARERLKQGAD